MNKNAKEQGLFELYQSNPDEADYLLFGRETHPDRRGFLKKAGLAMMGAMVGAAIPFHRNIPAHFIPVALAEMADPHLATRSGPRWTEDDGNRLSDTQSDDSAWGKGR